MTRFSIIVPHYDGVISDEMFIDGMDSIESSTFKDFEVLIYHDGPVSRPTPELSGYTFNYKFKATKTRYNDWGHSLRDLGIREAKGDYIVHFNPDNILYQEALNAIEESTRQILDNGETHETSIVICPIVLEGCIRVSPPGTLITYIFRDRSGGSTLILDGIPPALHTIDCMQLVAKRSIWLSEGGWYDKSENSDGVMYEKLCSKYDFLNCGTLIGVHR
jgi:hypothetical protein